jgi:autotransporter-associated beta strand protein
VKRGSGKLTLSNTAANTYTGRTTVEGGTLQLGAAAQTTVLANGADVQNDWSKLVFEYSGTTSSAANVLIALTSGFNNGWLPTAGAIASTTVAAAPNTRTLGWLDSGTEVTVMQTSWGDATLDGVVNIADLNKVLTNYGLTTGTVWAQGDFNYDGAVNIADLNKILTNYGLSLPAGALSTSEFPSLDGAAISALTGAGFTVVPEPGTLALLAAGLFGLLAYAWRKRK